MADPCPVRVFVLSIVVVWMMVDFAQGGLAHLTADSPVDAKIIARIRTHGVESCSICVAWSDLEADFRDALFDFFNVD